MHCRILDVINDLVKLLQTTEDPRLSRLQVVRNNNKSDEHTANELATILVFVVISNTDSTEKFSISLTPAWMFDITYAPPLHLRPQKYCRALPHHAPFVHSTFQTAQSVYINVPSRQLQWTLPCDRAKNLAVLFAAIPEDVKAFADMEKADLLLSKTILEKLAVSNDPRFESFTARARSLLGTPGQTIHFASSVHCLIITLLPQQKINVKYMRQVTYPEHEKTLDTRFYIAHTLHLDFFTAIHKKFKTALYANIDPIELIVTWSFPWQGVTHLLNTCSAIVGDVEVLSTEGFAPPGAARFGSMYWTPTMQHSTMRANEQTQIPNGSPCAMMSRTKTRLRLLKSIVNSIRKQPTTKIATSELNQLVHDIDHADAELGWRSLEGRVEGLLIRYTQELASVNTRFVTCAVHMARIFLLDVRASAIWWFSSAKLASFFTPLVQRLANTMRGLLRIKNRVRVSCSTLVVLVGGAVSGTTVTHDICHEIGAFVASNQECFVFFSSLDDGSGGQHANLIIVERGAHNTVNITHYDPHGECSRFIGAIKKAVIKLFEECGVTVDRFDCPNKALIVGVKGEEHTVSRPYSQNEHDVQTLIAALFPGVLDPSASSGLCVAYCTLLVVQILAAFAVSVETFSVAKLIQEIGNMLPNPSDVLGVIGLMFKMCTTGCPIFGPQAKNLDGASPVESYESKWRAWNEKNALGPIVHGGSGDRGLKRKFDYFDQTASPPTWSKQTVRIIPHKLAKKDPDVVQNTRGSCTVM